MREIKFRGKRLDNGEWEYGDLLQYDDGSVCIGVHSKNYTDDGFNVGQIITSHQSMKIPLASTRG